METPIAGFAKERIESNNEEILKIFTCPVCLNLFRTPKLIPNCGHTVCLDCIKQLLPDNGGLNGTAKLTCPECRSENEISKKDVEKLKTNFPAQQAAEVLKAEEEGATFRIGDFCPHVAKFSRKRSRPCSHCDANFCNGCLGNHLEKLKMETKWMASRFIERLESTGDAEAKFQSLKLLIEGQAKKVKEEIQSEADKLLVVVQTAIKENCDRLMASVDDLSEAQLSSARQIVELNASLRSRSNSMGKSLHALDQMSALYSSASEFADIYSKVRKHDKELFAIEELEKIVRSSELIFSTVNEEKVKNKLCDSMTSEVGLKLGEVPTFDMPSQQFRLNEAIKANDVEEVRKTYEVLPQAVRSFVTEHGSSPAPLLVAAESGAVDVLKFLVEEQHADIQRRDDRSERTLVHVAARNGRVKVIEYLVGIDPSFVCAIDNLKHSPLHLAAWNNHHKVVEFLIKQEKIDIEQRDVGEQTALHLAATNGRLKIVEDLVESAGANLMAADKDGCLPVHLAAETGHIEVVKYLVGKNDELVDSRDSLGNAPIHSACKTGKLDVMRFLLDTNPASVDARGRSRTPLHVAAANGHLEAVRLLVDRGANVYEATTGSGYLAIHIAACYGHVNVVKFFADHDANLINYKYNGHYSETTPLHVAIDQKCFDVAKMLVTDYKAE